MAQWLRNLIAAGRLPAGEVDDRDIRLVGVDDLRGFGGCHFFAGVGGWPLGAMMAGFPECRRYFTGSPPCQPFSAVGKKAGFDDDRDLWWKYRRLIADGRPDFFFSEQVKDAVGFGWLDRIYDDLESDDYALWSGIIPAGAVGSPQRRERLWVVGASYAARWSDLVGVSWSNVGYVSKSHWKPYEVVGTADGRKFRNKPGLSYVADGISGRLAKLRAPGNAICPQIAFEIFTALMECRP